MGSGTYLWKDGDTYATTEGAATFETAPNDSCGVRYDDCVYTPPPPPSSGFDIGPSVMSIPVSAGRITFALTGERFTIEPGPSIYYAPASEPPRKTWWSGGEQILIEAAGAEVPAFAGAVLAPPQARIEAPTVPPGGTLHIDPASDLVMRWAPLAATVTVDLPGYDRGNLRCTFDGTRGEGTLPKDALARFSSLGTISVDTVVRTPVMAGDWKVVLQAWSPAVDSSGYRYTIPATF